MYWLKFYEDGVFVTVIGQPHDSFDVAKSSLYILAAKMGIAGFAVNFGTNLFTYDRYGTLCTVKIEEVEE